MQIIDKKFFQEKKQFIDISDLSEIVIKNNLSDSQISEIISSIIEYETQNLSINIKVRLDNFSTQQLIAIFNYIFNLDNFLSIRNISIIQNILTLIKTYNTFDDHFFLSDEIYLNSIEQFLDVKMALAQKITAFNFKLISCWLSLFKSANKFEYNELDDSEDIELIFQVIFSTIDLFSIIEIFATLPSSFELRLKKYKNSIIYIDKLLSQYVNANFLMESMLQKMQINNIQE